MTESDNKETTGYASERAASAGGTGTAAAREPVTDTGAIFRDWLNDKLRAKSVMLNLGEVEQRCVELTPEGKLAVERLTGGGHEYVPFTARRIDDLMNEIF